MTYDYEHQELQREIDRLKSQISDLEYDISRLRDELSYKADKDHYHSQYQTRE